MNNTRRMLPNRRPSVSFGFECEGHRYRATASRFPDGALGELFLDTGKPNTTLQTNAETSAVLVSLLLQHGVPPNVTAPVIVEPAVAVTCSRAIGLYEYKIHVRGMYVCIRM